MKTSQRGQCSNQRGQMLVQVLVAAGVSMTILLVLSSILQNISRETQALSEKMASLDLKSLVSKVLADGTVCTYLLSNLNAVTFNPASIGTGATSFAFPLAKIPAKHRPHGWSQRNKGNASLAGQQQSICQRYCPQ